MTALNVPAVGTADAEIKVPPGGIPGLYQRFTQNVALHAGPADRTSTYLVLLFPLHSSSLLPGQTSPIINSNVGNLKRSEA